MSCVSENLGYRKGLDKKGGVSRFSIEIYLSDSAEELRRGTLSCFTNIGYRKRLWIRGGGKEYHDFPSKISCLTVPQILIVEPFGVSLISGIEKFYASEGYVTIFDFLSNFFCLTVPKIFIVEPYSVSLNSGTEKVYASEREEGLSRFSVEDLLSHSDEKFHRGKSFSVSLNSGTEKPWIREGEYRDFPSNIFCITVPKSSIVEPLNVSPISGTEKNWIKGGRVSRYSAEDFLSHSAAKFQSGAL